MVCLLLLLLSLTGYICDCVYSWTSSMLFLNISLTSDPIKVDPIPYITDTPQPLYNTIVGVNSINRIS